MHPFVCFLCHSSQDKGLIVSFAAKLRKLGLPYWLDSERIQPGDSIVSAIQNGLTGSRYLLVFLSKGFLQSPWVRAEYAPLLKREIESGRTTVIPVVIGDILDNEIPLLLADKRRLDIRRPEAEAELLDLLTESHRQTDVSSVQSNRFLERLYLLVLIDQFPNGIWGASLERDAGFYGHRDDPGSITVSTLCSIALNALGGQRTAPSVQRFRDYLNARRHDSGAFGMLKETGSAKYPDKRILEHTRHTATALRFFLHFDSHVHPNSVGALKYLLSPNHRTKDGLWVAHGQPDPTQVDPITVAYVIGACHAYLERAKHVPGANLMIPSTNEMTEAIEIGLNYLFSTTLRDEEGNWLYGSSSEDERQQLLSRAHQYSTDVLTEIVPISVTLETRRPEIHAEMNRLIDVSHEYDNALPLSRRFVVPSLDPSASLIRAALGSPAFADSVVPNIDRIPELCSDPAIVGDGFANGWSAVLLLAGLEGCWRAPNAFDASGEAAQAAAQLQVSDPDKVFVPRQCAADEGLIRTLLKRRQGAQPS
jgi:hypothetical protein